MIFSAQGLSIARGGRSLVARLDLRVHSGEALIVTGRNGAGKSSLLRAFAGMLPLSEGKIELTGHEGAPESAMHYLGHANGQKPQTRLRLERFRHAQGLDVAVLGRWDRVAATG